MFTECAAVVRSRDGRLRAAVAAGISKRRVHVLSGLGRMTIERMLGTAPNGPLTAQREGERP